MIAVKGPMIGALALLLCVPVSAIADESEKGSDDRPCTHKIGGSTQSRGIVVEGVERSGCGDGARSDTPRWRRVDFSPALFSRCLDLFVGIEDSTEHRFFETCLEDGAAVTTEQVVREAFEEIPIPASELVIQPPDGVTLVNLATLFRTDAEPFEETVTLLEQTVVLRIRPVGFTWHTGDGDWFTTTTPGLPYEKGRPMSDYVSHTYAEVHELVEPSVDVTWAAEYSVAGGSWFAVDGTVTITGPSAELQVKEAVPVLVGG